MPTSLILAKTQRTTWRPLSSQLWKGLQSFFWFTLHHPCSPTSPQHLRSEALQQLHSPATSPVTSSALGVSCKFSVQETAHWFCVSWTSEQDHDTQRCLIYRTGNLHALLFYTHLCLTVAEMSVSDRASILRIDVNSTELAKSGLAATRCDTSKFHADLIDDREDFLLAASIIHVLNGSSRVQIVIRPPTDDYHPKSKTKSERWR